MQASVWPPKRKALVQTQVIGVYRTNCRSTDPTHVACVVAWQLTSAPVDVGSMIYLPFFGPGMVATMNHLHSLKRCIMDHLLVAFDQSGLWVVTCGNLSNRENEKPKVLPASLGCGFVVVALLLIVNCD